MKRLHTFGAAILGCIVAVAALGAVYNQFTPGGALSGTWNSQSVNLASGAFVTGTLPVSNGGSGQTAATDDSVMVGNGTIFALSAVPNCADTGGQHLNYLTASNAFACGSSGGSSGGSVTVRNKTGDTSFTGTTLANDPDIAYTGLVAGQYQLTCLFQYFNANATPDVKFQFTISTAVSNQRYNIIYKNDSNAATVDSGLNLSTTTTSLPLPAGSLGTTATVNYWFGLGSTSTLTLQWAQLVNDGANATVLRSGSGCQLAAA